MLTVGLRQSFDCILNYIELDTESCIAKLINQAFAQNVLELALCSMCSGQPIPDSGLSFSSATAGGNPS
ncbi:hypothetical protein, partial [Pseudomonas aeruginosa]|uniref:hypothetical protein n=1 Tax=Pseudomonas aeruginosa TaxID=287 RepID=UPI001EE750F9